jgi:hypothetical protein
MFLPQSGIVKPAFLELHSLDKFASTNSFLREYSELSGCNIVSASSDLIIQYMFKKFAADFLFEKFQQHIAGRHLLKIWLPEAVVDIEIRSIVPVRDGCGLLDFGLSWSG